MPAHLVHTSCTAPVYTAPVYVQLHADSRYQCLHSHLLHPFVVLKVALLLCRGGSLRLLAFRGRGGFPPSATWSLGSTQAQASAKPHTHAQASTMLEQQYFSCCTYRSFPCTQAYWSFLWRYIYACDAHHASPARPRWAHGSHARVPPYLPTHSQHTCSLTQTNVH